MQSFENVCNPVSPNENLISVLPLASFPCSLDIYFVSCFIMFESISDTLDTRRDSQHFKLFITSGLVRSLKILEISFSKNQKSVFGL